MQVCLLFNFPLVACWSFRGLVPRAAWLPLPHAPAMPHAARGASHQSQAIQRV
jgi:hypothetical protein